jgi:Phage P22-like portal protein
MPTLSTEKRVRKPATPKGYDSTAAFLQEMRENYQRAIGGRDEKANREAMREDIEFVFGEQWQPEARKRREQARKPVLTINRLPAYVAQVVGNRLLNDTMIRVYPDNGGTKEIAELREALIRSIFKNSNADLARDEALKYQVIGGVGYYAIEIDYAADDVFEQEIKLKHVPDPFAVVIDEMAVEPCGGDARFGFVAESIPRSLFEKKFPDASVMSFAEDYEQWISDEAIRVVSYWRMVEDGTKVLALMTNGTVQKFDTMAQVMLAYQQGVVVDRGGEPYAREVPNRFAQMYLCSGNDILEGPYDLPCTSIPIFRVPAWELRDGEKYVRWGLVRYLKDPQRLHNYWRSVQAEQLIAAPRNKWMATREAVAGYEKDWRASAVSDDPLLTYNAEGGVPQRVQAPPLDAALLNESAVTVQDMRDVSNIHEASLGQKSNEVSGRAITARQQIADLGTFIYHDRLRIADERCAKVINELIPTIYDTFRIAKIVGPDGEAMLATLNDPANPNTDVTAGKYAITVTTGPSTVTKRALAAEQMMAFVNAVPETAAMVLDLVAEAQDWPNADEFARRFAEMLPENLKPKDEMTPEQQQKAKQDAEMQAMQMQMQLQDAQLELQKKEAEIDKLTAEAEKLRADAQQSMANGEARLADVESRTQEREINTALAIDERTEQ